MRLSGTRWRRPLRIGLALLLAAPTLGCVSATSYDEVADERDQLREDKERLEEASQGADRARVAALDQAEDLREERDRLALEVKKLNKRVGELEAALRQNEQEREAAARQAAARQARWGGLYTEFDAELRSGQMWIGERPDGLDVVMSEALLFAPGSGELSAGGRAVLQRFALRVRDEDQRVEVEGEADAPPLRLVRGAAVMRALAAGGVPNEQLRAVSFDAGEEGPEDASPARRGAAIRLVPNLGSGPGAGGVSASSAAPAP